eukprot:TRINITY_DN1979_c0_g1::TRINITY_DN1979_c0_g1_i1::g.23125::m.23125 TRINITY_DN1979_c0_g1::TRINITY_DN1979_c0_g1_i1::g.23125  ORF type:complete len:513 (-),score=165.76,sp/A8JB22/CCD65_CHLRE/51.73/6e-148,NYD-SP28_assoc/PF14775.1/3.2e+03,NYD-SP28_assoc/PF14775.1/6.3e+03,NYD-SP28_assoc/PF14775.1/2.5e+03,NYD-SP28_assoc/PF14775.1/2.5e+03,NYD-SP28_assoc/PF14775.1/4.8e-11,NYD-SP28/PF14772.1/7.2e-06,NYD-SP28/PF14772.1/1.5e+04,NYD-SP28/PF14772.1/1.5e+04,Cas_GSU0054/PF09609.5/0.02,GIDA/PF01134.17/2.8e+02,GIDA/
MKGGAKVKKKGGSKKAETDEERALRLQAEGLRQEEIMKQKEEMKRRLLKIKQLSEEKYSRVNRLKIQNQWRKIMRVAKAEELRKEIEILSQNHEREVDRKDAIIQMYDRDLDEAEDQYQMALRAHLRETDNLLSLQAQRVKAAAEEFDKDLRILVEEFNVERLEVIRQHQLEKAENLDIMQAMENEFNDQDAEARQDFESQREEIKSKNQEEYNVLRITLETMIDELERHFDGAHSSYITNTAQRTQMFQFLTEKDRQSAETIEKQMKRLQKLQESLANWKLKIANNAKECEERNRLLREEKDQIARHFQELKGQMNRFRDSEQKRLTELTIHSHACISELKRKLKLAENILKISELNRKLETEREKILPFYNSTPLDEEDAERMAHKGEKELSMEAVRSMHAFTLDDDGKPIDEWHMLDSFFKRYNKVYMDDLALRQEKDKLERENGDLRAILKQYLDGISVNEDVMNAPNPLLVVNDNVELNVPKAHRRPAPVTVLEAAHIVTTPGYRFG